MPALQGVGGFHTAYPIFVSELRVEICAELNPCWWVSKPSVMTIKRTCYTYFAESSTRIHVLLVLVSWLLGVNHFHIPRRHDDHIRKNG